jgi:hypothetical protein
LVDLVSPYALQRKTGRPPFDVLTMLRIHFMQQWFTLSYSAMEEAVHDGPLLWELAGTRTVAGLTLNLVPLSRCPLISAAKH